MLAEMIDLVQNNTICVLATSAGNAPYCSLMAYVAGDDGREIHMVTHRTSKKFRNLSDNPAVSLLIDSRGESPRSRVQALTIEGSCTAIREESARQAARTRLLAAHPHLEEFMADSESEILCVRIQACLLLKGLTESLYWTAPP